MKITIKNILLGFLSWLVPFAISIPFFKPGGELMISHDVFKSIMIVTGAVSGCYLLALYFKSVDANFIKHGVIVGFSWFAINILFDSLILIPMMKVNFVTYFISIGLGYIVLPVTSITIGYLLSKKLK